MMRIRTASSSLVLALLASLHGLPVEAQRGRQAEQGGRGFFMAGVHQLDVDELNARFAAAGYPEVDESFLSLGGAGFAVRNRLVLGGEGHGLMRSSTSARGATLRTQVSGGYGMFNIGYAIVARGGSLVYPVLGLGGGGLQVRIDERGAPTFDDVLADPGRSAVLTNGQFLLSAGLGADHVFRRGARRGGFAVGLRAGYAFAPISGEWMLGRNDVADGPDSGITGPFLRISFGGGR